MIDTLFAGIRGFTTRAYRLSERLFYVVFPDHLPPFADDLCMLQVPLGDERRHQQVAGILCSRMARARRMPIRRAGARR